MALVVIEEGDGLGKRKRPSEARRAWCGSKQRPSTLSLTSAMTDKEGAKGIAQLSSV